VSSAVTGRSPGTGRVIVAVAIVSSVLVKDARRS
jgi:hypothetical protein